MTATLTAPWQCDVCDEEPAVSALPLPGAPGTTGKVYAYGQRCLDALAHPYDAVVEQTAEYGGMTAAPTWWRIVVDRTLEHLGISRDRFDEDVSQRR